MSLKRSQSAPQTVATLRKRPSLPRSYSQHLHQNQKAVPWRPAPSRVVDREGDPFSLSGFFPSSFGGFEEAAFRRVFEPLSIEEEEEEDDDEAASVSSPNTPSVMFDDELVRVAIKGADKMGVLSLDSLFSSDAVADDRLFSPYIDDDPVDHDSLHLALRRRREAHGLPTHDGPLTTFGELFLREERREQRSWLLGFL